ncbi:MAG: wfgD [Frankiales bacterium]|jgi:glycosyltransferase involved in cell wall biosynthesis|nr:wfgD [Frankiales bacterium]
MLAEAVASVRNQTLAPLEHLIVDDGSFSVTAPVGTNVLQVNAGGPGPARNAAIAQARGHVIALLDDDDLWHPVHLKTLYEALIRTGADVVYSDCDVENRRDGYGFEVTDFDGDALQERNFICLPATMVRTDALRSVGGFPDEPREEDWLLWKRLHHDGMRFHHVPRVTVTYRFHTDNLTYGGVDPERTRRVKELREAAERGDLTWEDYAIREAEVWA